MNKHNYSDVSTYFLSLEIRFPAKSIYTIGCVIKIHVANQFLILTEIIYSAILQFFSMCAETEAIFQKSYITRLFLSRRKNCLKKNARLLS